jgi:3-oxoacyl-[acyl-carrier protein] reductase
MALIGKNCKYIILNLSDIASFDSKLEDAVSCFGKIDILVNSAGVHSSKVFIDFLNVSIENYGC